MVVFPIKGIRQENYVIILRAFDLRLIFLMWFQYNYIPIYSKKCDVLNYDAKTFYENICKDEFYKTVNTYFKNETEATI